MMGRAQKRKAAKTSKKTQGGGRDKTATAGTATAANVVPLEVVKSRLKEVPVFRISGPNTDGSPNIFLDAAEAEAAAQKLKVDNMEVLTLDIAYFDDGNVLQPSRLAVDEAERTPKRLTPDVRVPVFFVDGLRVQDKVTGEDSLPMFFRRSELLGFAKTAMEQPEQRVAVADLSDLVGIMLRGPAGVLRGARFFASETALEYVDQAIAEKKKPRAVIPSGSVAGGASPGSGGGGVFPGGGGGGIFPD